MKKNVEHKRSSETRKSTPIIKDSKKRGKGREKAKAEPQYPPHPVLNPVLPPVRSIRGEATFVSEVDQNHFKMMDGAVVSRSQVIISEEVKQATWEYKDIEAQDDAESLEAQMNEDSHEKRVNSALYVDMVSRIKRGGVMQACEINDLQAMFY